MNWIQSKIPDLPIKNFTADWNDGKRLGALVDSVAPGLCPDWPVYFLNHQIQYTNFIGMIFRIGIQKIQSKMHLKQWVWQMTG